MCRSYVIKTSADQLLRLFGIQKGPVPNLRPRWNLCPTDAAPIVRLEAGERRLDSAIWDYRDAKVADLKGRRPLINVQGERFRNSAAFARQRCLVPTDGFYEFTEQNGRKQPFHFRRADGGSFAFGGAWSIWDGPRETLVTFTLLTTAPGALVADIHDRMPLVLDPADWDAWLSGTKEQAATLVRPNALTEFVRYPVSTRVNSVRNDDPSLTDPAEPDAQGSLALG